MRKSTPKPAPGTRRPDIDWDAVEATYREGIKSNRQIADEHGVSEGSIRNRARTHGWVKGSAHEVRALAFKKADDVAVPTYIAPGPERIEALAEVGSQIIIRHRTSVASMASLVKDMVEQLHDQTHNEDVLGEELKAYFLHKAAENPLAAGVYKQQMNHALHAISLGARSKTMLNLSNAAGKLMELERKAWKLDDVEERSYEDLLAELLGHRESADGDG